MTWNFKNLSALVRQFGLFLGVGLFNTVIGLILILGLSRVINYLIANLIGYIVGICIGFVMHRSITFRGAEGAVHTQAMWFFIVFAIAFPVQFGALYLMVHKFHWGVTFAQIVACGLYTVINFTGNKVRTFKT